MSGGQPSTSRCDVVVVGGGPAGLAASYTLARAGLKVICLERGDWPGSKNMMGGLIFSQPTSQIVPDFWQQAPLERHVTRRDLWLTTADSALKASYESEDFAAEPYNSFTVFRSRFDKWLAAQAQEQGAVVISETLVEDLLWEGERIVGVRTGRPQGDLEANLVIICEGVNHFLTEKAGLAPKAKARSLALGVKEVLAMPQEKIEDRFGLEQGSGAAIEVLGEVTGGLVGTGFIYTNRDTVSVGVGVMLGDLTSHVGEAYNLLEQFKRQPQVRRLLAGASPREYLAHLIPEGGYHSLPRLYGHGVLVAGDAASMVNAVNTEGANLALLSGKAAAETAIRAHQLGSYDAATLAHYQELLQKSVIIKDLKQYQNVTPFLNSHRQLFSLYPELLSAAMKELISVDSLSKQEKHQLVVKLFRSHVPTRRMLKDLYDVWRALA